MSKRSFAARALALATLAALTAGGRFAAADPPKAPATAGGIDWCKGRKLDLRGQTLTATAVWQAPGFDHAKIRYIAQLGCSDRLDDGERAELLKAHDELRRWSKLPATDLRAYLSALIQPGPDPIERVCRDLEPRDQATRGLAKLLGCDRANEIVLEDDASSMVGSAGVVYDCLSANVSQGGQLSLPHVARFAMCGAEARRLDRAAIDRELAALRLDPAVRTMVRLGLRQIETVMATFAADLAPQIKGDPVLQAFFYEVPDKAFRLAERAFREGAEDLAVVRAYEARVSLSARPKVAGCLAELRPRLLALLARLKVTTLDRARHEMVGPIGYQLSRALQSCAALDGHPELAQALSEDLRAADDYRGPRTMVYWFLRDALEKMEGRRPAERDDLTRARVPIPDPLGRPFGDVNLKSVTAAIKKVSRRKGAVLVEFNAVVKKDTDRRCWDTKRVHSYSSDGSPVYYKECGKWKEVTQRSSEEPALVAAENAGGLAPGRVVAMFCSEDKKPRVCAPFAVWKDGKQKALVGLLGAKL